MSDFALALSDIAQAWPALLPPNRVPVSQGAADVLKIGRPGGGSGPWKPELTPYMVEPTDMLASRAHTAVCFVGGAQAGKTVALGEAWLSHVVVNDPGDMCIYQMTQDKAREYSRQRIDRAIRNSEKLKAMLGGSSSDDNLHDKTFRNGMMLRLAWPTVTNMSSSSYRYTFGTDYDRWPDDIDGEGDGFTLMCKRTTTFLSRGMTAVESTPGRLLETTDWRPSTPHEAPPVKGILGIYNRSDRRRWYWKCPHCGEHMQAAPGLGLFGLPTDEELLEDIRTIDIGKMARQFARVVCPNSGCIVNFAARDQMNRRGRWLADGLTIDELDRISGNPRTSSIAGFWLGGLAATYLSWETMIQRYLQGLLQYQLNGSELELLTTTNTDQGMPYMPRHLAESSRAGALPIDRAEEGIERYIVPEWARFVLVAVDVQGGRNARFEVQVHAIGEYQRQQVIDRYALTESKREGYGGNAPVDPAGYVEDWSLITEKVVNATYRIAGGETELRVKAVIVDTGGEDGVTTRAYQWWRGLRQQGLHKRVVLSKGAEGKADWFIRESMVGGKKQGLGDVPLQLLNSNLLKDAVAAGLKRQTPGPNYYHFPKPRSERFPQGWLLASFFDELSAETRGENGKWVQHRKRNEAFDLCYMIRALCMILGADKAKFWERPPAWALPFDKNSEVVARLERRAEQAATVTETEKKATQVTRRSRASSYMG